MVQVWDCLLSALPLINNTLKLSDTNSFNSCIKKRGKSIDGSRPTPTVKNVLAKLKTDPARCVMTTEFGAELTASFNELEV